MAYHQAAPEFEKGIMKLIAFLGRYCGQPANISLAMSHGMLRDLAIECGALIREENDPTRMRGR